MPVFYLVTFFFAVLAVWIQGALSRRSGNRCFHISRNKQIIRTRPPQGRTGSDYIGLVRETGLEPVRHATHAPQTCLSANSSTRAYSFLRFFSAALSATFTIIAPAYPVVNTIFKKFRLFLPGPKKDGEDRKSPPRILLETHIISSTNLMPSNPENISINFVCGVGCSILTVNITPIKSPCV